MRLCRGIGPGARPGTWDVLTRTRSHAVLVLACLLSGLVAGCYETQPPDPVTGLSCRAKPTKVDLVWDPAPRAVAYQVERSVDGGEMQPIAVQTETVYADQGLQNGRQVGVDGQGAGRRIATGHGRRPWLRPIAG